jgi:hypothetical protein
MSARTHSRRRVVGFAALASGALWLGQSLGFAAVPEAGAKAAAASLLDALFRDRASARAIGRSYLAIAASPEEQSVAGLLRALFPAAVGDARALETHVAAAVREDFATGRVVTIGGWMLCRTEARLCALAALAA